MCSVEVSERSKGVDERGLNACIGKGGDFQNGGNRLTGGINVKQARELVNKIAAIFE